MQVNSEVISLILSYFYPLAELVSMFNRVCEQGVINKALGYSLITFKVLAVVGAVAITTSLKEESEINRRNSVISSE